MARTKGKATVQRQAQALERLEVIYASIDQIRANEYNPNRQSQHDFDLLKRSISEDGFTQPIVAVRTEDPAVAETQPFTIVDGEHRWRAAAELGYTELPLAVVPMTLAQAKIATLRHNRARGSEDVELATEVLRDLERLGALDWAADSLQLDDAELDRLLNDIPAPEALAGEEYGEAWVPDKARTDASPEGFQAGAGERARDEFATPQAVQAQRDREQAVAAATTDEERRAATAELVGVYRIALQYREDEAAIVKEILGAAPAVTLLTLCLEEKARRAAAA